MGYHNIDSADELRKALTGAWSLESYISYPVDPNLKSRPTHPMSKAVKGIIMYNPDGFMSVQMTIPGQKPFTPQDATDTDWAESGRRYFAYTGPFHCKEIDGDIKLQHHMMYSSRPDMAGNIENRVWRFEEDGKLLILTSEHPSEVKGEMRMPELRWRRIDHPDSGSSA